MAVNLGNIEARLRFITDNSLQTAKNRAVSSVQDFQKATKTTTDAVSRQRSEVEGLRQSIASIDKRVPKSQRTKQQSDEYSRLNQSLKEQIANEQKLTNLQAGRAAIRVRVSEQIKTVKALTDQLGSSTVEQNRKLELQAALMKAIVEQATLSKNKLIELGKQVNAAGRDPQTGDNLFMNRLRDPRKSMFDLRRKDATTEMTHGLRAAMNASLELGKVVERTNVFLQREVDVSQILSKRLGKNSALLQSYSQNQSEVNQAAQKATSATQKQASATNQTTQATQQASSASGQLSELGKQVSAALEKQSSSSRKAAGATRELSQAEAAESKDSTASAKAREAHLKRMEELTGVARGAAQVVRSSGQATQEAGQKTVQAAIDIEKFGGRSKDTSRTIRELSARMRQLAGATGGGGGSGGGDGSSASGSVEGFTKSTTRLQGALARLQKSVGNLGISFREFLRAQDAGGQSLTNMEIAQRALNRALQAGSDAVKVKVEADRRLAEVISRNLPALTEQQRAFLANNQVTRASAQAQDLLREKLKTLEPAFKTVIAPLISLDQALGQFIRRGAGGESIFKAMSDRLAALKQRFDLTGAAARQFQKSVETLQISARRNPLLNPNLQDRQQDIVEGFRDMSSAAVLAMGPLSGLGARLQSFGAIVTRSNLSSAVFLGTVAALGAGIASLTSRAIDVRLSLEGVKVILELTSAASERQGQAFEEMAQAALDFGLTLDQISGNFAKLKIATRGLEIGENFNRLVRDFGAIAGRLELDPDAQNRMLKAFEQMFSKGLVQAEEFRQQLGDVVPGSALAGLRAFRELTDNAEASMGQFMKAMTEGQVRAPQFVPKFLDELRRLFQVEDIQSVDTLRASFGRLNTSLDLFINKLDQQLGLTDAVKDAANDLSGILQFLSDNISIVADLTASLAIALGILAGSRAAVFLSQLALSMSTMTSTLGVLAVWAARVTLAFGALGAAVGLLVAVFDLSSDKTVQLNENLSETDRITRELRRNNKAPIEFDIELPDDVNLESLQEFDKTFDRFRKKADEVAREGFTLTPKVELRTNIQDEIRRIGKESFELRSRLTKLVADLPLDFDVQPKSVLTRDQVRTLQEGGEVTGEYNRKLIDQVLTLEKTRDKMQGYVDTLVRVETSQQATARSSQELADRQTTLDIAIGKVLSVLRDWAPALVVVTAALASARQIVLAVTTAVTLFGVALTSILGWLSVIAVALAAAGFALSSFAGDAGAAETDLEKLQKTAEGLVNTFEETRNLDRGQATRVADRMLGSIDQLQNRIELQKQEIRDLEALRERVQDTPVGRAGEGARSLQLQSVTQKIQEHRENLEGLRDTLNSLGISYERVTNVIRAFDEVVGDADRELQRPGLTRAERAQKRVERSIDDLRFNAAKLREETTIMQELAREVDDAGFQTFRRLARAQVDPETIKELTAEMRAAKQEMQAAEGTKGVNDALKEQGETLDALQNKRLDQFKVEQEINEKVKKFHEELTKSAKRDAFVRGRMAAQFREDQEELIELQATRKFEKNTLRSLRDQVAVESTRNEVLKSNLKIQQQYNETVRQLKAQGVSEEAAREQAARERSLSFAKRAAEAEATRVEMLKEARKELKAVSAVNQEAAEAQARITEKVKEFRTQARLEGLSGEELEKTVAGYEKLLQKIEQLRQRQEAIKIIEDGLTSFTDKIADLASKGELTFESLGNAFSDMAQQMIADIIKLTLRLTILKPLLEGLGGGGGLLGGLLGGGVEAGTGNVSLFAKGGVIDRKTMLAGGGGIGIAGEAGPEAILPLRRGPGGRLGVAAAGGSGVSVSMPVNIDARGADAGAAERIEAAVEQMRREVPGRAVAAVADAQTRGVL